jgi:hypothetical protein
MTTSWQRKEAEAGEYVSTDVITWKISDVTLQCRFRLYAQDLLHACSSKPIGPENEGRSPTALRSTPAWYAYRVSVAISITA